MINNDKPKKYIVMQYKWYDWNLWDMIFLKDFDTAYEAKEFVDNIEPITEGLKITYYIFENKKEYSR
jgi:hypothetical protein